MENQKVKSHLTSFALRTLATSNTMHLSPKGNSCGGRINSPMTNLTLNLSELSTGRITPRRKLSLCSSDSDSPAIPTPERQISAESGRPKRKMSRILDFDVEILSGCFVDAPSPVDSPTFEMSLHNFAVSKPTVEQPQASHKRKTIAFRRYNSMPVPPMRFSPLGLEADVHIATQSTPQSTDIEAAATGIMNLSDSTITDVSSSGSVEDTSPESQGSSGSISPHKKCLFYMEESNSQDSGLECDRGDSRDSSKDMDMSFEFAAPRGMPPLSRRHMKVISEDTCSPFKYSPVKDGSPSKRRNSCPVGSLDFSGEIIKSPSEDAEEAGSPLKLCRLTSMDEGIDDGFLDIMDEEVASITAKSPQTSRPKSMVSLFDAPLINKASHTTEDDDTPVTRRTVSRRNLLGRSQSMFGRPRGLAGKRDQPEESSCPTPFAFKHDQPQDESTPIQEMKRRRPSSVVESPNTVSSRPSLHRCHSETEAMIMSALNRQAHEPDLVGDCSRSYCLPTIKGKHQDLKSITSQTLTEVLRGDYSEDIEQAIIVDCRYPYEFQGGHIEGALNLYTNESIINEFMKNPIQPKDSRKRVVLVFHCEFSSERGPKLSRFLRSRDRQVNKECYPKLHYPELYLLDGGYKAFYEHNNTKEFCEPRDYKPMLHKDHSDDLRHFRTKSKSWAGERGGGRPGFRPLIF